MFDQGDVDGEIAPPLDELLRSIERIDQKEDIRGEIVAGALFLGHDGNFGECGRETIADHAVGPKIGFGHRRRIGLGRHVEIGSSVDLHDLRARVECQFAEGGGESGMVHGAVFQLFDRACLWTSHRHLVNIRPRVSVDARQEGPPMNDPAPSGILTLQTIAMPANTNANGDIFGGWLMAQMDLGSSVLARGRARGRVATVAVEGMTFHHPVLVGDVVSIHSELLHEGTTSMNVGVEVWITRQPTGERRKVTKARFVFVAVDETRSEAAAAIAAADAPPGAAPAARRCIDAIDSPRPTPTAPDRIGPGPGRAPALASILLDRFGSPIGVRRFRCHNDPAARRDALADAQREETDGDET